MRMIAGAALALLMAGGGANAADGKGIRFWNLASVTIAKFYMAPAGTTIFGANQCENDRDGTVSPDERLKITNVTPGKYDIKLADTKGRVCIVRNVAVEADKVFSIEDRDLKECSK